MRPLFISLVCDFCDGLEGDDAGWDVGYVVWRGRPMPVNEYVFATREDGERWKRALNMKDEPILLVRSPVKFRWRKSTGTIKDVTTADGLVTIFADRRFPPGANRAYLART
ncbi:hypothetical protein LZC95_51960 [Pendulispora brunnea]|uniref:Uncharacterized protein n=1 Tax=Pendulispora brunnea TaxID=2905690 RepID=A0ABZ2KBZ3_9BACT